MLPGMIVQEDELIRTLEDLVEYYRKVNWEKALYVGIEWERSGVYREGFGAVRYPGENGYNAVLHKLVEEVGWHIVQSDHNELYELQRGETHVTLEGDGRLELAGSPQESLHDLARELRLHNHEVVEMGNIFGIGWLPMGVQPLHTDSEIELLGKDRYSILQEIGDPALMATMTKRTNGLTANLSFTDEQNAIQKAQTAFRILPIIGAIYASSPFDGGELAPYLDLRRHVIQNHAPARTGIPPTILDEDFSLSAWLSHYVDIPVVLMEQEGREVRADGSFTFRTWMEEGRAGRYPTAKDFDRHVKTTWSDIRLRPSYLEYRVADSVPFKYVMSLPAIMKGLLFDSGNWQQVRALTDGWTYEQVIDLDRRAWKEGLRTEIDGKSLLLYAQELVMLANEKLHSFGRLDSTETDESVYLCALKEQVYIKEQSFAEELRELWQYDWKQDTTRVLEWCEAE
ncbi:MAG: glutamate-cysteine ligase family protein [Candidatus Peribacteraceae bacterium]|nr:glutamate-cysteine ligase family protein [Candidatus Peribacteraceae bacterium]